MDSWLVTLLFALLLCSAALAVCPDDAADLVSWNSKFGTTSPNDEITISRPVLLDTSVELFGLTIASGGRLVWSRAGNYGIRTHYIKIQNGGELHIGSPTCKFGKKARITLLGEPTEKLNIPGFGEKFLGVEAGGVLNLYGEEKLSWTKITQHAHKFDPSAAELYNHKETENVINTHGIYIYHFKEVFPAAYDVDRDPGIVVVDRIHRSIKISKQSKVEQGIADLMAFLNNIPNGDIFALATHKGFIDDIMDYSTLYEGFDVVAPSNSLRLSKPEDAYVAIGKKGDPATFMEDLDSTLDSNDETEAIVVYNLEEHERELVVTSQSGLDLNSGSIQFIVFNTLLTRPILPVIDDVTSWKTGDKIFVTSTDYDWEQVEEFTVVPCSNPRCSINTVRLDRPFEYDHYGEIYNRVDMRAEVGLMTRHIVIDAEVFEGNSNGGHVKFVYGFKDVQVEGVELTNLGQPLVLGRYPLHYHMCEDLSDTSVYPTQSVLRKNSIHHTQFRCVTIHGTHNVQLIDNVCYDSVGHGFFLEDGGEKNTYIRGNLGLGQRRFVGKTILGETGAIPTDQDIGPVTFWITNPLTTVINNAAAGGEGMGMWYVYPDLPTGPSREKDFMQDKEARHTKITLYKNNVQHSYLVAGLFVDNIQNEDLTATGHNLYNPHQNSLDPTSPYVPAVFERVTAYKNKAQNLWIRGSPIVVRESSFADSQVGAVIIREDETWVEFINNVVVGYSDNLGKPNNNAYTRSYPTVPPRDVVGYRFDKGPVYVRNTWFHGFQPTSSYNSTALSNTECFSLMNPQNMVENVLFSYDDEPGSRILLRDCQPAKDEDGLFTVKDVENGLTGSSSQDDVTLVKNIPFHVTSQCKVRDSWNMAYCPYNYGEILVSFPASKEMSIYRTDGEIFPKRTITNKRFMAILGQNLQYLVTFENGMPGAVTVVGQSITRTDSVVVAYCVPRDAVFVLVFTRGTTKLQAQPVTSLAQVQSDAEGGKYYFDQNVGVIFFKLVNDVEYGSDERTSCPSGQCVSVRVKIQSGTLTEGDCYKRFIQEPSYIQAGQGNPSAVNNVLRASAPEPPEEWGAGSTYPQPF